MRKIYSNFWFLCAVSSLFIPAFLFGAAPVWGVLFAVALAFYFHAHIGIINEKALTFDDHHFMRIMGLYALLLLKMSVAACVPPILLLWSDMVDGAGVGGLNAFWLSIFPFKYLVRDIALQDIPAGYALTINAIVPVFIGAAINLILSYTRMLTMIALFSGAKVTHHKEVTVKRGEDPMARYNFYIVPQLCVTFGALLVWSYYGFFNFSTQNADYYSSVFLSVCATQCTAFLFFLSNYSLKM